MDLQTLVSFLWTKTHTIKIADLPSAQTAKLSCPEHWKKTVNNPSLKAYLAKNQRWYVEAEREIKRLQQEKISFCHVFSPSYPKRFLDLKEPPLFFSYLGNLDSLNQTCLAVVGSRNPSQNSLRWMESHFYQLVKNSHICVVSGGAIGIDQMAHDIAVLCDEPTVAILPSGFHHIYPNQLEKKIDKILSSNGLLISEYEINQRMQKHHFQQRNRLIAALGDKLLIVEAQRKSGSLITAKYALDLGRDILVIPSHPFDESGLGSLDLLCDGAIPVRDYMDLIAYSNTDLSKSIQS